VHDRLAVGDPVSVRGPRNNFALVAAPAYLFVAGGIRITPLLPILRRVAERGFPWRVVYLGRAAASMPYLAELIAAHGDRVLAWPSGARGRLHLAALLDTTAPGTAVYCCGPEVLLAAVEELGAAPRAPAPPARRGGWPGCPTIATPCSLRRSERRTGTW
jgi:ferredoxin-NADP reductase